MKNIFLALSLLVVLFTFSGCGASKEEKINESFSLNENNHYTQIQNPMSGVLDLSIPCYTTFVYFQDTKDYISYGGYDLYGNYECTDKVIHRYFIEGDLIRFDFLDNTSSWIKLSKSMFERKKVSF